MARRALPIAFAALGLVVPIALPSAVPTANELDGADHQELRTETATEADEVEEECAAAGSPDVAEACALHLRQLRAGRRMLGQANATAAEWKADRAKQQAMGGPPPTAMSYAGQAWPDVTIPGTEPMHIFAIGDWGGMDGTFQPEEKPRLIVYKGGHEPGPHVYPRSRPGCDHDALTACYDPSKYCSPLCGFDRNVDTKPQLMVAEQFNLRAARANPSYVLNVGDSFYYGGIAQNCGHPMNQVSWVTKTQFQTVFEQVYRGPGVDGKLWFGVLGNHDYGGRTFNWGWDAVIAYTWASKRWVLPAPYYSVHVDYPDQDFSIDYLMMESNNMDAQKSPSMDPDHNICSMHNDAGASCASSGGPASLAECYTWFWDLWAKQKLWVEDKLAASKADWQIIVTHFPCGFQSNWFRKLHNQFGLDLLVTGHRHSQELWSSSPQLGGLTCFVTGGGGGITSENSPVIYPHQYGFFDLTVSKSSILVESVNYDGRVTAHTTVSKKDSSGSASTGGGASLSLGSCATFGCGASYVASRPCQCTPTCRRYRNCCSDFADVCAAAAPASASESGIVGDGVDGGAPSAGPLDIGKMVEPEDDAVTSTELPESGVAGAPTEAATQA